MIVLVAFSISIHTLLIHGADSEYTCGVATDNSEIILTLNFLISAGFFSVIPIGTLIITNAIFIFTLRNRKKFGPSNQQQRMEYRSKDETTVAPSAVGQKEPNKEKMERNYTQLLIAANSIYLVSNLLQYVLFFVASYLLSQEASMDALNLKNMIPHLPILMNHSVNFIFYFASSAVFREAFKCWLKNKLPT